MDRRSFLQSGLAAAALGAGGRSPLGAAFIPFPCGVASGDPGVNEVVLWTKVDPSCFPGAPSSLGVEYEIAPTLDFAPLQTITGQTETSAERDHTVKVKVKEPALEPFTHYFYRFRVEGSVSPWGRFRTLPRRNQAIPRLRLAFLSCQDYTNGYYPALGNLLWENIDYVVHLGDYIYETTGDPAFQNQQVRPIGELPSGGTVADTLEDYRFLYSTYRSDFGLQVAHGLHPFIHVWDDHEFQNDSWKQFHPDNNPSPNDPQDALRQVANRAWSEYIPAATPFDADAGPLESLQIFRSLRFGRLAQLVMTDQRLYRDGPPCGLDQRYVSTGCPEHVSPTRTMLGVEQKEWFLGKMADSGAIWNVWGNEVMAMALKLGYTQPVVTLSMDQWDGFPAEREELMTALVDVQNLVAVTGDIHSFGAGYLHPNFLSPLSPRAGVEFIGGSVSSSNLREILESTGSDASAVAPKGVVEDAFPSGLIEFLVRVTNPHIQFFNSDKHGYGILDITPERTVCELKAVSTVRSPFAPSTTLARFVVPRDIVDLIPA